MQIASSTKQLKEYLETRRGKTYLISIVTLLTVAVMLVFAIVPAVISITDKLVQNETRRDYLAALERNEKAIKSLLEEEQKYNPQIVQLESALADQQNDEYIVANIIEMTARTGTQLVSMDFKEAQTNSIPLDNEELKVVREVPITISVQGRLDSLSELLKKIESFPSPITVDTFALSNKSISSLGLDESKGDYMMTMDISYYYYNNATK